MAGLARTSAKLHALESSLSGQVCLYIGSLLTLCWVSFVSVLRQSLLIS